MARITVSLPAPTGSRSGPDAFRASLEQELTVRVGVEGTRITGKLVDVWHAADSEHAVLTLELPDVALVEPDPTAPCGVTGYHGPHRYYTGTACPGVPARPAADVLGALTLPRLECGGTGTPHPGHRWRPFRDVIDTPELAPAVWCTGR